jgi:hypothetical protein
LRVCHNFGAVRTLGILPGTAAEKECNAES